MKKLLLVVALLSLVGCVETEQKTEKKCNALFDELYDTTLETQRIQRETIKLLQNQLSATRKENLELQIEVHELRAFKAMLEDMKAGAQ